MMCSPNMNKLNKSFCVKAYMFPDRQKYQQQIDTHKILPGTISLVIMSQKILKITSFKTKYIFSIRHLLWYLFEQQ